MKFDFLGKGHPAYPTQRDCSVSLMSGRLLFAGTPIEDARPYVSLPVKEISRLRTEIVRLPQPASQRDAGRPADDCVCVWIGTADNGTWAICWSRTNGRPSMDVGHALEHKIRIAIGHNMTGGLQIDGTTNEYDAWLWN